jgi:hypothetical protein
MESQNPGVVQFLQGASACTHQLVPPLYLTLGQL